VSQKPGFMSPTLQQTSVLSFACLLNLAYKKALGILAEIRGESRRHRPDERYEEVEGVEAGACFETFTIGAREMLWER
jgi:hypothetical protein